MTWRDKTVIRILLIVAKMIARIAKEIQDLSNHVSVNSPKCEAEPPEELHRMKKARSASPPAPPITYGLKITVTRSDLEGIELQVDLPEFDHRQVCQQNPALAAILHNFDAQMAGALKK